MEDILYGRETNLACKFKEHLIFDEQFEFLNKFCTQKDSQKLLMKRAKFVQRIMTSPRA